MKKDAFYIKYNKDKIDNFFIEDYDAFYNDLDESKVNWLHINNYKNDIEIKDILSSMNVSNYIINNIFNDDSIMITIYDDYLFMRASYPDEITFEIKQVVFLLFSDKLISLSSDKINVFDKFIDNLLDHSIYRNKNVDFLFSGLLDNLIENYFLYLESISDEIDKIEDELLSDPSEKVLNKIYYQKRELIEVRGLLWPLRNIVSEINRFNHDLISEGSSYYFNDIYNKIIQLIDIIETYHELGSGMLDTYLSSIGNKTNEVMKVLTIFSTIFIPLSFLAGVFGMNFTHFPEIHFKYGYVGFWVLSLIITLIMLRYFRKKGWF